MKDLYNPFTQTHDGKLKTLSISDLSKYIKDVLEISLNRIRVKGEIIGLKKSPTGHYYFDLKEKVNNTDYVLNAIIWKWTKIHTNIENGQSVIVEGKLSSYSGKSSYNIIVDSIETEGIGNLLKEIEERRRKLQEMGIFSQDHKKQIPYLPNKIGIITSESGAVIRDILHRLYDRFPVHVLLRSVSVQGEDSKNEIIQAIKQFDAISTYDRPDVIIIARGGGSLQDLMVFNDEDIVMSVYNCSIPIISAIGHETDYTLIDYVADLRAPTPTAAAEFVVPVLSDLKLKLDEKYQRLLYIAKAKLDTLSNKIYDKLKILKTPKQVINDLSIRLDDKLQVFDINIKNFLKILHEKLKSSEKILDNLSFKNVLKRGYAIIRDDKNHIISDSKQLINISNIIIEFSDSKINIERKNINLKCKKVVKSLNKNNLYKIQNKQESLF